MREARDKLVRQFRSQMIQKHLETQRKIHHPEASQEVFKALYPKVDEDNYPEHKHILRQFSLYPEYGFPLCAFGELVYQFILQHPHDVDSIDILKAITVYEDVEIPQTEQFSSWLISLAAISRRDSLIIVGNLLGHSRYVSALKDNLIEGGYLEVLSEEVSKEDGEIGLAADILSSMLSSHPVVNQWVQKCACLLSKIKVSGTIAWVIGNTFSQIRLSFPENKHIAECLFEYFQLFLMTQFAQQPWNCLSLLTYCANCSVFTNNKKIIHFMTHTFETQHSLQACQQTFDCIELYLNTDHLQPEEVSQFLYWVLRNGTNDEKKDSLRILNQHRITITLTNDYIQQVEMTLLSCLQDIDQILVLHALKLIWVFSQKQPEIIEHLSTLGIQPILEELYLQKNQELVDIVEVIIKLFPS